MHLLRSSFLFLLSALFIASCGGNDNQGKTGETTSTDTTTQNTTPDQTASNNEQQIPSEPPASDHSSGQSSSGQATTPPAAKPKPEPTYVTMPESTAIMVKLVDSIDTDIDSTGEKFRAVLAHPVIVNGTTLFSLGANAEGVLDTVIESGHMKTPAEIKYHLTAIQNENGDWVNIDTYVLAEKHGSHTKRQVAMIGGGAIVGGIIGKVIDKKGSTEIGAVAGAAAGTAAAALTGKQDIVYPAGTEVVFILKESERIAVK